MITPLIAHIQKYIPLTLEEQKIIEEHVKYTTVKKKQYLFSEGDVCSNQYFVLDGCIRMYFIKHSGVEQIVQFAIDNWWISDYTSLTLNTPSPFYLQAVQPGKLAVLKKDKQDELFTLVPKMEHYFRRIYQRHMRQRKRAKYIFQICQEKKNIRILQVDFRSLYSVFRNICWLHIWALLQSF
jgi:CRP/FNR family transcriptional regulator